MINPIKQANLFIALNPSTDDALIDRLQVELDAMKQTAGDSLSEYNTIVSRYFKVMNSHSGGALPDAFLFVARHDR